MVLDTEKCNSVVVVSCLVYTAFLLKNATVITKCDIYYKKYQ